MRLLGAVDVFLRESTHPILVSSLAQEFGDDPWGAISATLEMVEYGLVDYFPCGYLDKPTLGEAFVEEAKKSGMNVTDKPWLWNLDNKRLRDLLLQQDRNRNGGENDAAIQSVFDERGLKH